MTTTYRSDEQLNEAQRTTLADIRETARRLGWVFYTPDEGANEVVAMKYLGASRREFNEIHFEVMPSGRVNVSRKVTTATYNLVSAQTALTAF